MKKFLVLPLCIAALSFTSCSEEPLNMECDILYASVHLDDPNSIFRDENDTLSNKGKVQSTVETDIKFEYKKGAVVGSMPLTLTVTDGAKAYIIDEATQTKTLFQNGDIVDFSGNRKVKFNVVSQDGAWNRTYTIFFAEEKPSKGDLFFDFEDYVLDVRNSSKFYIFPVYDENIVNSGLMGTPYFETQILDEEGNLVDTKLPIWQNGNPGFKLSKSSAKPMEYPTIPVEGGSVDGSTCIKLETMDTGAFGKMVNMRIASGSLFTGLFDVENALKDALKATVFGNPFAHKPARFEVDLKFERGVKFQDKAGKEVPGVIDEPDVYVVFYKNHDENGKPVQLDGNDVLSSPYIVGKARLPHNYTADGKDLLSDSPIHGVTSEWQHFTMDIEYTEEIDRELLSNKGYSMIIGFASSWQGAYFQGAVGTKLWIDNVRITSDKAFEPKEDGQSEK